MSDSASPARHFHLLEDIAQDLSVDANFPTCLDASLSVRNALRDPLVSVEKVARIVHVEPLIAAKLLRLANSAFYGADVPVTDVRLAIQRVGFETVRATSLSVAMEQMLHSRSLCGYEEIAQKTWEHSLHVAAIGHVLARRVGRVNCDEAMLAGMVRNIGVFYLLFRVADYEEYQGDLEAVLDLLSGWHESIGENLLAALGLPQHILDAIHTCNLHKTGRGKENDDAPFALADVLYFASLLAENHCPWLCCANLANSRESQQDRARFSDLLAEAQNDIREILFMLT
ncbi:MAG: HDOD domain-containing protein [Zoogloeaceae bacterium]|jgi:HD-like signal output (HDOD) protein|nr:HDOD domain-containing protein [Zoogloeaceae bacterium]